MTKSLLLTVLLTCFVTPLFGQEKAQDEEKWMDLENCEICKPMAKHPELVTEIPWEVHLTKNGFMSVMVVPEKHKAKLEGAEAEMQKVISRAMSGEEVTMCPHCQGYGEFIMAGVNMEEFQTDNIQISLITSTDGEIIEKLHEHARKTKAAHAEMLKEHRASQGKSGD